MPGERRRYLGPVPTTTWYNLSDAKRNRVLGAAEAEFGARGFEAGSLNVIAAEAGVAKGSLFQYFEDKVDLYQTVLVANATAVAQHTIGRIDSDAPFFEMVRELFEYWIEYFGSNPRARDLSSRVSGDPDPAMRQRSRASSKAEFRAALIPQVERGISAGELRPDTDVDLVVSMVSMTLRHLRLAVFERDYDPGFAWSEATEAEIQSRIDGLVDVLRLSFGPG